MRDLGLDGLSEDQRYLLLRDETGEQYRVPADDRLRAASRGDRARLGQVEISMDNALRPRDIQSRIRAGESPEAVAAVAQMSVERIMAYAVPVLAEREHVCQQARRSGLRRKHASGPGRLLGDAVDEHLRARGLDPTGAGWDSWRRNDGRWSVTVAASRSGEPATFLYDVPAATWSRTTTQHGAWSATSHRCRSNPSPTSRRSGSSPWCGRCRGARSRSRPPRSARAGTRARIGAGHRAAAYPHVHPARRAAALRPDSRADDRCSADRRRRRRRLGPRGRRRPRPRAVHRGRRCRRERHRPPASPQGAPPRLGPELGRDHVRLQAPALRVQGCGVSQVHLRNPH